jgi:hypothetical protein
MWDSVGFTLSLSKGEEAPEVVRINLVEMVRVLGRKIVLAMRVKGEKPFGLNLRSLESGVWKPSMQRAHNAYCYTPPDGAPLGMTPFEPGNHGHRLAPRKPPGLM